MARKIVSISLLFGLALAALSFAAGQKEPGTPAPAQASVDSGKKLVLTGSLSFTNLIHPTLKSGDTVYELMVPRYLVYQAGVKEGAQVTVEGYQVQGIPWMDQDAGNEVNVFVTKATIDGKDYDLSQLRGAGYGRGSGRGGMMSGGGRGMMGTWGHGL